MKPNPFDVLLEELRSECDKDNPSVIDACSALFGRVVSAIFERPGDIGVSVVHSFAINNKAHGGASSDRAFLIVMRAETRAGERVIAFIGGEHPQFAIGQLLLDASTGQIQWRPDDQSRNDRQSFADLISGTKKGI